jgi:multimeric flavodoxin WrbA
VMANVPIFVGSPRKGNTLILALEAEKALNNLGISTEIIMLNDLSIAGCQACYACKREGNVSCLVQDDMQRIYNLIEEAAGVIVATPIYFGGVTAQTKLWLDRLFPYLSMDLGSLLPRKIPLTCVYTQNQPDPSYFTGAMKSFEFALGLVGFSIKNRVIGVDLDTGLKPMATEYPKLMKQAWQVGCDLIS